MTLEPVFAVAILISYVLMGHMLENWKKDSKLAQLTFHESVPTLLLGAVLGLAARSRSISLDGESFFEFVLPFIILQQGYALKKKNFFRYLYYIVLFGIVGTVIVFGFVSAVAYVATRLPEPFVLVWEKGERLELTVLQCMKLAAVLSAADEVATMGLIPERKHPKLSAILFGEGVVNDAVSILLFRAVSGADEETRPTFSSEGDDDTISNVQASAAVSLDVMTGTSVYFFGLLGAAIGLGCGCGLLVSVILKHIPSMCSEPTKQTAVVLLGGYLSFSLSEALGASGILAVFFCGITMSHYAWHSLSDKAKVSTQITTGTLGAVSEAYCFAALGLSLHNLSMLLQAVPLAAALFLGLFVARFFLVFVIVGINNSSCCRRKPGHGMDDSRSLRTWSRTDSFTFPPQLLREPSSANTEGDLSMGEKSIIWTSGLVRGAVAFAQVQMVDDKNQQLMENVTMVMVLFTTVVFGCLMPFIVKCVTKDDEEEPLSPSPYVRLGAKQPYNDVPQLSMDPKMSDETPDLGRGYASLFSLLWFPLSVAASLTGTDFAAFLLDTRESGPVYDRFRHVVGYGRMYQWWAWIDDTYMKKTFGGRSTCLCLPCAGLLLHAAN